MSRSQDIQWTLHTPCHPSTGIWNHSTLECLLKNQHKKVSGSTSLTASWSTHFCKAFWSLNAPVPRKATSWGHLDESGKKVIRTYFKIWGFRLDYSWTPCFFISPESSSGTAWLAHFLGESQAKRGPRDSNLILVQPL